MGRAGGVLLCLVVALVFGGVGAFASWAIGSTIAEAHRTRDWVRVKATVERASLATGSQSATFHAEGAYRYSFAGREYSGSRLGLSKVGGSDNIDDWHEAVNARLEDARAAGRPITVWVDPDNPADSVLDRDIRWNEIVFFVPFALAFGGVGVGALVAIPFVLRGKAGGAPRAAAVPAQGGSGAGFVWLFAFFWNALSFPIAILAVPQVVRDGEWAGLLVLLFPLVGVGLLWAAASATVTAVRARLRGAPPPARAAASAPGRFAAQAARAMFDPQAGSAARFGDRARAAQDVPVPASVADVQEQGGTLTLRYRARRRLGLAVVLFVMGAVFTAIGAAMFAAGDAFIGAVVMLAIGTSLDLGAVSLLVGNLVVSARPGEIEVEQSGLRGRRSWRLRREEIRAIRPVVSYSVNGLPYFSIFAEADGGRVPLGTSIKGADLAGSIARRIARSVGLDRSAVAEAEADAGEQDARGSVSA